MFSELLRAGRASLQVPRPPGLRQVVSCRSARCEAVLCVPHRRAVLRHELGYDDVLRARPRMSVRHRTARFSAAGHRNDLRKTQVGAYCSARKVTADEVLKVAQDAAEGHRLRYSVHATQRMQERQASQADVRSAVIAADVATPSDDGPNRWLLCGGQDVDGCELRVIVAIDGDTVWVTVVTVFPP